MMDMAESANRIYAIKTTAKQERTVADNIEKVTREQKDIHVVAVMVPEELKGYVLVESPDSIARIEQLVELIPPHARAVVQGSTALSEVEHFLVPKKAVTGITEAPSSRSSPARSRARRRSSSASTPERKRSRSNSTRV